MKKGIRILLVILAALVLLAAGICWWQWDNIKALRTSLSHSREDLSQMLEENKNRVDSVKEQLPVDVRDLTEEELSDLEEGKLSRDELIGHLTGKGEAEKEPESGESQPPQESQPVQSTQPEPTQPAPPEASETPAQPEETNEDKLARYIAEIYVMKAEYTKWLENAYDAAIAEYVDLPEEKRTTAAKYEIGMKYMRSALTKEDECDKRMAEIEKKIYDLLVEMGEDTSLVDEIQAAYKEEKELKKAYYLGLHG